MLIAAGCVGDQRIRKQRVNPQTQIYVVEKGDTLSKVARKFGISAASIKKANDLTLGRLSVGQRLTIPKGYSGLAQTGKTKKRAAGSASSKKPPRIKVALDWPIKEGVITSAFGVRKSAKHDGIDIGAPKGSSILAAADGKVIFSGWGPTGYGRLVVIKHSPKIFTVYAHNSKNLVKEGDGVKRGETIGLVGRSGRVRGGPNLHFEVRINRIPYDPRSYLPKKPKGIR